MRCVRKKYLEHARVLREYARKYEFQNFRENLLPREVFLFRSLADLVDRCKTGLYRIQNSDTDKIEIRVKSTGMILDYVCEQTKQLLKNK
jgi:hypothetical protein